MKLWRVQAFSVIGFFHSGSWIIVSNMNLAVSVVVVQTVWLCLWSSYRPFGRVYGRRTDRLAVSMVVVQTVWPCIWSSYRPFGCVCGRRTDRLAVSVVVAQTVVTNLTRLCRKCWRVCLPTVTYDWFPVVLKAWHVPHVGQERLTLSWTPDFTHFDLTALFLTCFICHWCHTCCAAVQKSTKGL